MDYEKKLDQVKGIIRSNQTGEVEKLITEAKLLQI
jgi:hypothetical protein